MALDSTPEVKILPAKSTTALVRWYVDNRAMANALIAFFFGAVLWELITRYLVTSRLIISPLSSIGVAFVNLVTTGEIWKHLGTSAYEFAIGFAAAAVLGIVLGIVIGTSELVREFVDPWIAAIYATPIIALAPLFIIVFGIGPMSKIAVVFLLSIFPIIVTTQTGIRSTDEHLLEAARSFCATRRQIFLKVMIPAALSFIVAGLRLGLGRGLIAVVVGEMFGSRSGLGFLILVSSQGFDTAGLYVGVIILAITGVLTTVALQAVERHLAPWRFAQKS